MREGGALGQQRQGARQSAVRGVDPPGEPAAAACDRHPGEEEPAGRQHHQDDEAARGGPGPHSEYRVVKLRPWSALATMPRSVAAT